ncbi:fasciclin domain-containing protein [Alteromonas sp. A081]|uniref:fasciclin domain-containing protein n=1 Tax=Alteromonas sp. A081 TaxID=3410269 RepID=UPI003B9860CE
MNLKIKAAFLAVPLTLSGCWLDDDDDSPAPQPAPPPEATTIVDVAVADGNFTTLVAALEAADLVSTLDDENGSFTVFAPTDDAFEALGQETIDALLADTDALTDILTYHVLSSEVNEEAAIGQAGSLVETVNGASIALSLSGDNLLVNTATVTMTDIATDNGIIHVIDAVLMPPEFVDASDSTIAQVAAGDEQFSTLVAALTEADLVSTLDDPDATFTVFAPTDAAFAMIDEETLSALLEDTEALTAVLLQHVLPELAADSVTAFSLNGTSVETASGASIPIAINEETDTLTVGGANVVVTNIQASNGIVHVIDTVIVGDVELPTPAMSIVDVAAGNENFSTLVELLQSTGLDATLADTSTEFTVFAPSNAAFDAVDEATLTALAQDADALTEVLTYHVVQGATVLQDGAFQIAQSAENKVETVNGSEVALSLSGSDLYVNSSLVSQTDIMADNGVIHVVDQVILPIEETDATSQTIADIAAGNEDFSTLVAALSAADLVDTLADETATFTVFAPTNTAFDKIEDTALSGLLADTDALSQVLLQHVIPDAEVGAVDAFAANGTSVNTVSGEDVAISIINFTQGENTQSDEVAYDIANGRLVGGMGSDNAGFTLYTFDNDLGSATSNCNDACADIWMPLLVSDSNASGTPGLSTVERSDGSMQAAFQGRPLYFFANDSEAGDNAGDGVNNVWFDVSLPQTALMVEGAIVTTTDIKASNGTLHIIDSVITETLNN